MKSHSEDQTRVKNEHFLTLDYAAKSQMQKKAWDTLVRRSYCALLFEFTIAVMPLSRYGGLKALHRVIGTDPDYYFLLLLMVPIFLVAAIILDVVLARFSTSTPGVRKNILVGHLIGHAILGFLMLNGMIFLSDQYAIVR